MKFRKIVALFLLFRTVDFIIVRFSQYLIPYLGFFPYKEIATQYNLPNFLTAFANFDGAHYLLIAKNGYTQYQQAFFPLYPLLIRWLSPFFLNNRLLAALIISNVSFLFGLFIFSKYLKLATNNQQLTIWSIIFLLAFPTSFFFAAVYTEGLFFLLFVLTLYLLKKEKYGLASISAFLASLTKFVGLFLIIFFILKLIKNWKLGVKNFRLSLATLSPILGLSVYSFYLWLTTHDSFFFLHSQWAFGANRSSNIILLPQVYFRYLKIFFTAQWNFQYFISLFEFGVFNFVLFFVVLDLIKNLKLKIKNYEFIGLGFFSFINLTLPALTGTLSSIPRYALFSLSFFIYLSNIKNLYLKITIVLLFILFHVLLLGFFSQGYFVS